MSDTTMRSYDPTAYTVKIRFIGGPQHGLAQETRCNEIDPGRLRRIINCHVYINEDGWRPGMESVDLLYDNGPLEGCPFCGEMPEVYSDPGTGKWIVTCRGAECPTMWSTIPCESRQLAINAANKRDEHAWRRKYGM